MAGIWQYPMKNRAKRPNKGLHTKLAILLQVFAEKLGFSWGGGSERGGS